MWRGHINVSCAAQRKQRYVDSYSYQWAEKAEDSFQVFWPIVGYLDYI